MIYFQYFNFEKDFIKFLGKNLNFQFFFRVIKNLNFFHKLFFVQKTFFE